VPTGSRIGGFLLLFFFLPNQAIFYQYFFSTFITFSNMLTSEGELFALLFELELPNLISALLSSDDTYLYL